MGLVVAGGLSPTTLHLVQPLIEEFPDVSIDAEGRLRDHEDHLDLQVAGQYLSKAFKMFFDALPGFTPLLLKVFNKTAGSRGVYVILIKFITHTYLKTH